MLGTVQERFNRNAHELSLTEKEIKEFYEPQEVNEFILETPEGPVTAVRTQHHIGEDGSGGGFKIVEVSSGLTPEEMLRRSREQSLGLATLMTLKGGLIDLDLPSGYGNDFGGAKGVMLVPKGTLSTPNNPGREKIDPILTAYVETQKAKGVLGIGIDRHAPDMNTGAPDMDVMAHTLREFTGDDRAIAAFSGKSIENGGLEGREIATAQGLVHMLENHLRVLGLDPKETTVAVQGSGNVGGHFAILATEQLSVKIIGISDQNVAVVGSKDNPLVIGQTVKLENRQIASWNEELYTASSKPDDLLEVESDVFVFAGPPDVVTEEKGNIDRLKARIILQGANNPMDTAALDYYIAEGRAVSADIDGNKGGFVTSNLEYNQGMTGITWTEADVLRALKKVMDDSFEKVIAEAGDDPRNLVDPAFRVAINSQFDREESGLYVPVR